MLFEWRLFSAATFIYTWAFVRWNMTRFACFMNLTWTQTDFYTWICAGFHARLINGPISVLHWSVLLLSIQAEECNLGTQWVCAAAEKYTYVHVWIPFVHEMDSVAHALHKYTHLYRKWALSLTYLSGKSAWMWEKDKGNNPPPKKRQ